MVASGMARYQRDLPTYRRQGTWKKVLRNVAAFALCLYAGLMLVEGLFLRGFIVRSESMAPAVAAGDHVVLSPLVFGKVFPFSNQSWLDFGSPARGDLVQVRPPYFVDLTGLEKLADSGLRLVTLGRRQIHPDRNLSNLWESSLVIRRVIGLPGDAVFYSAGTFMVRPAGEGGFRTEFEVSGRSYQPRLPKTMVLEPSAILADQSDAVTVPPDMLFVACDNRTGFLDSRHWALVSREDLRGQLLLRIWPLGRLGLMR